MTSALPIFVVVPAAGAGRRMRGDLPKQYLRLFGKTILEHTLEKLLSHPLIERIVVAVSSTDKRWQSLPVATNSRVEFVEGGDERQHSVLNGLDFLKSSLSSEQWDNSWVMVHDVARPCVALSDIDFLIESLSAEKVGGILAVPLSDTVKQISDDNTIVATLDRSILWRAQTPQMFRSSLLISALRENCTVDITDEASAVELAGFKVKVVKGSSSNIKITLPEDLGLAEYYLAKELGIEVKQ